MASRYLPIPRNSSIVEFSGLLLDSKRCDARSLPEIFPVLWHFHLLPSVVFLIQQLLKFFIFLIEGIELIDPFCCTH